jgi:hypothetical protein
VGWDPQGNIFISDGYCNNRVVKYSPDGRFITKVGSENRARPWRIHLPHGMQVDQKGNVWVADRSNFRYQVLDNNLKPIKEITNLGVGWTACSSGGAHQYMFLSELEPERQRPGHVGDNGRNLQGELDGTVVRQVRQARQARARFAGHAHDGLPQPGSSGSW